MNLTIIVVYVHCVCLCVCIFLWEMLKNGGTIINCERDISGVLKIKVGN